MVTNNLTRREREVLELVRLGLTNEEIAQRLGITLDGAKYHVSQILSKLGVATREEAAELPIAAERPRRHSWLIGAAGVGVTVAAAATIAVLAWGAARSGSGDEAPDSDFSAADVTTAPIDPCPSVGHPHELAIAVVGRSGPLLPAETPQDGFWRPKRIEIRVDSLSLGSSLETSPMEDGVVTVFFDDVTALPENFDGRCVAVIARSRRYECGPACDGAGYFVEEFAVGGLHRERAKPTPNAALEQNRELWASKGVDDYRFVVDVVCHCASGGQMPLTVTVNDGTAASLVYADGAKVAPTDPDYDSLVHYWTIDRLFAEIEIRRLDAVSVSADYDPVYGFPTLITIDNQAGIDDEVTLEISGFEVIED